MGYYIRHLTDGEGKYSPNKSRESNKNKCGGPTVVQTFTVKQIAIKEFKVVNTCHMPEGFWGGFGELGGSPYHQTPFALTNSLEIPPPPPSPYFVDDCDMPGVVN